MSLALPGVRRPLCTGVVRRQQARCEGKAGANMWPDGGSWITGTERKHFVSFSRLLPLLWGGGGGGGCFLSSNGELGKYT